MLNSEYYVFDSGGTNENPLLEWDQKAGIYYKGLEIKPPYSEQVIQLRLGEPIPPNPVMIDCHSLPDAIISKKIEQVLTPMKIAGTQCLPARITHEDLVYDDYFLLHVFNEVECLDREKAVFTLSRRGRVIDIESLWLNEEVLAEIPLEERLIFLLKESTSTCLVHKSVKDAIESVNPEGVSFFRADQWGSGAAFS
ncbi:MAG: hypothetical protein HRU20_28795 [Pseudomonadales bacterium]|nr:hypothetical protein [Pseudomonadales bacterium]